MNPDEALRNFNKLVDEYKGISAHFNEAETRAKIIDRILKECLGWEEKNLRREDRVESGFTDYQLLINENPTLVIEAKKVGEYFEFARASEQRNYKIGGVLQTTENCIQAMEQVRRYAIDIGCRYAAVFNGHQLIVFSTFVSGKPWKESYATIFHSLEDMQKHFNGLWNLLSYENVKNGSLFDILDTGKENIRFKKVIDEIHNPDELWERNNLYTFIQPLSDLVFSELLSENDLDPLNKCYVSQRSNRMLGAEIQNYFIDKLPYFANKYNIKDIFERENKAGVFEKDFLVKQREIKGSLMVLMGGIGSGKSTFLHHFFKVILADYDTLLWFYIDFRNVPSNPDALEAYILNSLLDQWYKKYAERLTHNLEKLGFAQTSEDAKGYLIKLFNLLHTMGFSITITVDNVDRHDIIFQEKIFIISNHLADIFKVVVILSMREETFMASTKIGVLDAYYIPKFHISSPEFLDLIKARLNYAIDILKTQKISYPEVIVTKLIQYFGIIRGSLRRDNLQSRKLVQFINNISVGNMREALAMFTTFMISGNTNIDEVFARNKETGWYQIAYHQFIKSVIMGEHRFYSQERSYLMNIYDFDPTITDSHFNGLRILNYLNEASNKSSPIRRGYVAINEMILTAENVSVRREVVYDTLARLVKWKLVEFDNQSQKDLKSASYVKLTSAGYYYLYELGREFVYLDPILVDTPISDDSLVGEIKRGLDDFTLETRLKRTGLFVKYLNKAEEREFTDHPEYLNSEFAKQKFSPDIVEYNKHETKKINSQNNNSD